MSYIQEIRDLVGTRPFILTGVTALVINQQRSECYGKGKKEDETAHIRC